jgi:hypothetical protein
LLSAGIIAVSPDAVIFATRVKPYAFDGFSTAVLLLLAVRVIGRSSWSRWVALAGGGTAAVLFSASVLPVALSAITWCAWTTYRRVDRTARPSWFTDPTIVMPCAFAVVVGVFALFVLSRVPPTLKEFWAPNYITNVSSARSAVDQFVEGLFPVHVTGVVVLIAVAVGLFLAKRDLMWPLMLPIGMAIVLAAAKRAPFGGGRTDVYLYPCVAVAIGVIGQAIIDRVRLPRLLVSTAAVAIGLLAVAGSVGRHALRNTPYPAADIGKLARTVDQKRGPGDGVVVAPFSRYAYALYGREDPRFIISDDYSTGFTVASPDPAVFIMPAEFYEGGYDPSAVARFARGRQRIWYIATDTPESDTPSEIQATELDGERELLAAGYVVVERHDVYGAHAELLAQPS